MDIIQPVSAVRVFGILVDTRLSAMQNIAKLSTARMLLLIATVTPTSSTLNGLAKNHYSANPGSDHDQTGSLQLRAS